MARRDALLRLHKSLLERRESLRSKLAGELANLRESHGIDTGGDSADAALMSGSDEMSSQLAELDAAQIDPDRPGTGSFETGQLRPVRGMPDQDSDCPAQRTAVHDAVHQVPARAGKLPRLA